MPTSVRDSSIDGKHAGQMAQSGHGAKLRLLIKLASPRLSQLSRQFWVHPRLKEIFPEYLLTLYASVRATVPLLEAAAERARALATDPVAVALVPYLVQHAREELHHDEWLLEDMQLFGIAPSVARNRHAPSDVAEMIGTQYYWLYYSHPISLLGCFAVLEGNPPEVETLDGIVARSGIPKAVLRTLYKHAQLDPHHRDDLNALLDRLPLTAEHSSMLCISALTVVEQLGRILERLLVPNSQVAL